MAPPSQRPASDDTVWPPAPGLPALVARDAVHLVGVGGAGMSGLARALVELGLRVSGSDRAGGPELSALAAEGVTTFVGHDASHVPGDARLVVHSPAVGLDNPELAAARARRVPITKRAVLLGALVDSRVGLAVAGTHGKTSTSAMLAFALDRAGLQPGFFIGAHIPDLGGNARMGRGPHLVVEADEYDRTFLHGHPMLAIITNLEHDHPDIYPDMASLRAAFRDFCRRVRPEGEGGHLVVNASSDEAWRAAEGAGARRLAYHLAGDAPPPPGCQPWWEGEVVADGPEGQTLRVRSGGEDAGLWQLALTGRHQASNALAVIAASEILGLDRGHTASALASFRGADRRFQLRAAPGGIPLIDDYAHHPTEILATVAATRRRFPGRRVLAVVEPHTYSRVGLLEEGFRVALAAADRCLVCPIYGARELPVEGLDHHRLAAGVAGAEAMASLEAAGRRAAELALAGEADGRPWALLFMGAGRIQEATAAALEALAGLAAADPAGSPAEPGAPGLAELEAEARHAGLGGEARFGASLADHCSLRVGGPAGLLVRARSLADLAGWWRLALARGVPVRVIGRGSNVVVGDGGLPGLVLLNRAEGLTLPPPGAGDEAEVVAESGLSLAALSGILAREGWAGPEAGVGIPGSVGAAVVTNAGAHGWEMADSLLWAELAAPDGSMERLGPAQLAFRYRGSGLKGLTDRLVTRVALRVRRDAPAAIQARIAGFTAHRRATQPRLPSVGSVFENPPGDFAGRLIEAAGLKGLRRGDAEISAVHANFIVNASRARAADVMGLLARARSAVRDRCGVTLDTEVEPIGLHDAPEEDRP